MTEDPLPFYLGIDLDEINVYETIPSDSLDHELQEYLQNTGVNFHFMTEK